MKKLKQSYEIKSRIDGEQMLRDIEEFAKVCYKSEHNIKEGSARAFVKNLIKWKHESPLEHCSITVKFYTDRGCYDEETMVLTKGGWKYFSDLKLTDQIITIDTNNTLLYTEPVNIVAYPYQGKMYAFKSKQLDLLVTPDHRMWVYDYNKRNLDSKVWKFIEAQDCTNQRYKFNKSSKGVNREGLKELTIEGYTVKKGFYTFTYPTKSYDSKTFLKLLGLWLTDGYCSNRNDCGSLEGGIIQIKHKQREVIKDLLHTLDINYSVTDKGFYFNDQPLLKWLKNTFLKEDDNKKTCYLRLPRTFINSLNKEELQSLLEGIILGDGTKITNSTGYQVYTASFSFAQDLSEIALLVGLSSNIRTQKARTRTFPNGVTSQCQEQYIVSLIDKSTHLFDKRTATVETVDYSGMVYCVELPKHHRLFVQRNGKSVWCGNCSHEIVRHRIASYTQESTRYCVAGNTKITLKNPHQQYTVKELFNEVAYSKDDSWEDLAIMQCNESTGELRYSKFKNVMYNGEKECYKLTTKLGYTLECTADHKVLTPRGYKELQDLKIGEAVLVNGVAYYKDPDCSQTNLVAYTDEIISIEPIGVQEVYDIEMDSEFHNFVANGIVVHNCNYSLGKFDSEISIMLSDSIEKTAEAKEIAEVSLKVAEQAYMKLLELGIRPEDARDVLPTCLKTEIVCTYNLREWRHIFKLRTSKAAHPKVRALLTPLLKEFKEKIPVVFDDIEVEEN